MLSPLRFAALASLLCAAATPAGAAVTIDSFDNPGATGSVIVGSSWDGQITRNATSLTIGGTALDDAGWQWVSTGTPLSAAGQTFLSVTGFRNAGHDPAALLVVQFTDASAKTVSYTFSTANFAIGTPTTLTLALNWTGGFSGSNITSWTLGGGDPIGSLDYRMTLSDMSFTTIPEPAAYAAAPAVALLALGAIRRRKTRA